MTTRVSLSILNLFNFLKSLQFFGALAVPFYLHRVGLDYFRMFVLEAVFSFCMIALEIPTGVVADRFGRKLSLFIGSIAYALAFLIYGFTVSYSLLLIAELICAAGMCLLSGADRALVYERAVERGSCGERSRRMDAAAVTARYDAFGTAGMLAAFPVGTLFAGSGLVSYRGALGIVFSATSAAIFLAALVLLFVKEPTRAPFKGSAIRAGVDGFLSIFRDRPLTRFSLNYAAVSALSFFMFWFYQSLLMENGFPIAFQGFIAAGFNGCAMALLLLEKPIGKALGTKSTLFLSSLIPGLLYLGVAFIPGLPMALAAIFGVTMLRMFRSPLLSTLMNERIESSRRATTLSGVSMLERVFTTTLYPIAGFLSDLSLSRTFVLMGGAMVLTSVFLRVNEEHLGTAEAMSMEP
jgi:MFS family permease